MRFTASAVDFKLICGTRVFPGPSSGLRIASWCNGSTSDSGSLCHGSNPCEAVIDNERLA